MKNIFRLTLVAAIFMAVSANAYCQNGKAYFILDKANYKIIADTAKVQKTLNLEIAGLDTKQQLEEFITTFKTLRGVVSVSTSDVASEGKFMAGIVLYRFAGTRYFQNLLKWAGVNHIFIDNVKYEATSFSSIKID